MLIGGLTKLSLIDYPDQLAAVVFTCGCPFRCQFCHNATLVIPSQYGPLIPEEKVLAFLEKRKKQLDGVVITGGEPTLHKDLKDFIKRIKQMGYLIKLDTCGAHPEAIQELLEENLLDYIAMDLKAPLKNYAKIAGVEVDHAKIVQSIALILNAPIKKEFRSTLVQGLHSHEDVLEMAKMIKGAPLYSLQKYINQNPLNPELKSHRAFTNQALEKLKLEVEKEVKICFIINAP